MSQSLRTGLTLGACVLAAVLAISLVYSLTRERIELTQREWLSESLYALLPDGPFDNDPLSTVQWLDRAELGRKLAPVYTVYKDQKPYAAVLGVTAPDGYNGAISFLLGVHFNGDIIGVRVTEHNETPGLGDDIELRRSDWILSFNGHSLATTSNNSWAVTQAGGMFDAFTGATITPRAMIQAIHRALQWYELNRTEVFTS